MKRHAYELGGRFRRYMERRKTERLFARDLLRHEPAIPGVMPERWFLARFSGPRPFVSAFAK